MDDLISRSAAIDALKRDEALVRAFGYQHAIDAVQALPSVQPTEASCWGCNCPKMEILKEQKTFSEMVHLHDAETHDKHTETHSCDCERTETHEWIPVSEALPEDGVTVWVTIRGHDVISCEEGETLEQAIARIGKIRWVTQGYWSEEEHGWNDPSFGCPLMVQPIAWMPMEVPEPWQGGQDET